MSFSRIAVTTLAAAVTTLAVSGASAADLIVSPQAPVQAYNSLDVAIATDDWTGFYIGANVGGGTTNDFNEANSAWMGGVQAGYLQQFGNFVIGGELAATYSDDLTYELTPGAGLNQNWSVEAEGRAGVALDTGTLLYGTAGVAFAELSPTGATTSAAETHAGAIFGAGVEQALGNGWSLQAEYTQTRFWDINSSVAGVGRTDSLTNHAITAGVNYRF